MSATFSRLVRMAPRKKESAPVGFTHKTRTAVAATTAVLAMLTAAGCGRHASTKKAAAVHTKAPTTTIDRRPTTDPCTLVPQDEATAVLGPIGSATEDSPVAIGVVSNQRVCAINLASDPKLGVNVGLSDFDAARKFDNMRKRVGAGSVTVPDLGQQAQWYENFRMVLVLQGRDIISVQVRDIHQDPSIDKDRAVAMARIAVSHIGSGWSAGDTTGGRG